MENKTDRRGFVGYLVGGLLLPTIAGGLAGIVSGIAGAASTIWFSRKYQGKHLLETKIFQLWTDIEGKELTRYRGIYSKKYPAGSWFESAYVLNSGDFTETNISAVVAIRHGEGLEEVETVYPIGSGYLVYPTMSVIAEVRSETEILYSFTIPSLNIGEYGGILVAINRKPEHLDFQARSDDSGTTGIRHML